MLESLKAPFTLPIASEPEFMRFGGLVLKALGILAAVATLLATALVPLPMLVTMTTLEGPTALGSVVSALVVVTTLVIGAILVSMLGTTLRMWEARDPRGRQYAATLGMLAVLWGVYMFGILSGRGASPEGVLAAFLALATGVALMGIGLHPAGRPDPEGEP